MGNYNMIPWGKSVLYKTPTGIETTLYSIGTVAEALGRTRQTIRKWEVGGIIPPTPFKINGIRMYSTEHIDALVKCAEQAHLKNGSAISQTTFTKHIYEEFDKINKKFFNE